MVSRQLKPQVQQVMKPLREESYTGLAEGQNAGNHIALSAWFLLAPRVFHACTEWPTPGLDERRV